MYLTQQFRKERINVHCNKKMAPKVFEDCLKVPNYNTSGLTLFSKVKSLFPKAPVKM